LALLSPSEDLARRTLAALRGKLEKLNFLAGLRADETRYEHWGLARTYGAEAAQQAMAEAHQRAFLEVLSSPLPELDGEAAQAEERPPGATLPPDKPGAEQALRHLAPADTGGGLLSHLKLTLETLWLLARHRRPADRPGA
jgi:hypothetical protein